ncbi:Nicotinamidase-related amidase [Amphritea atlantica]|jgi:nicotinamidase-related amidase|uniref:Nicotinamidase-related amidase n=1 Tax=Amphritea atlantica TaxID=355243 RepID=A0A1H9I5C0_9GAMM|nr:hydrolase [Amphritea atlantica]SEQ69779.1 Nicotinamidase-related amidase [Amphritea atlantica]
MLIYPNSSCLLVVDIQEKLVPAVHESETLVTNVRWLAEVAKLAGVPILTSEQYPKGLGRTVPELLDVLPEEGFMDKLHFSCMSDPSCNEKINSIRPNQVIIVGMEAHVCVMQTAIQIKQQAREVYVVADAVSSRNPADKQAALERMRHCGIHIVTKEMVGFEWIQKSGTEEFKTFSTQFLR